MIEDIEGTFSSQLHESQYREPNPIDMILNCPSCGMQHVDEPTDMCSCAHTKADHFFGDNVGLSTPCARSKCECAQFTPAWDNPPHRSHSCSGCGTIWRPADVPTNGVEKIETRGKADTWPEVTNDHA